MSNCPRFGGGGIQNDVITGSNWDDTITGGDGLDTIDGLGGEDTINGGPGGDIIDGGGDNDTIFGGEGEDDILGGPGKDTLDGGADNDSVDGGTGDDTITGGGGEDTLWGAAGKDTITATGDASFGGDDEDVINGTGALVGGPACDLINGVDDCPYISVNSVAADEDAGTLTFTISASAPAEESLEINVSLRDGSATQGLDDDYPTLLLPHISIPTGASTLPITITINDDDLVEGDENFYLDLSVPCGVETCHLVGSEGEGTIIDDDYSDTDTGTGSGTGTGCGTGTGTAAVLPFTGTGQRTGGSLWPDFDAENLVLQELEIAQFVSGGHRLNWDTVIQVPPTSKTVTAPFSNDKNKYRQEWTARGEGQETPNVLTDEIFAELDVTSLDITFE